MATVVNRPNGHRWIQFKGLTNKRHTIRLGKVSKAQAQDFKLRVERLLSAKASGGAPDIDTSRWVASLLPDIHARLAATGLTDERYVATVGDLLKDFQRSQAVEQATKRNVAVVCSNLFAFFGRRRPNRT